MRTTTQDPLAEKYYDISPYAWCANNPVNLVDPDGRRIKIVDGEEEEEYVLNSQYTGKNEYIDLMYSALNEIYLIEMGKTVLDPLISSDDVYTIRNISGSKESTNSYNEKDKIMNIFIDETIGNKMKIAIESIAHESFHAYQSFQGNKVRTIHSEVEAYLYMDIINHELDLAYPFSLQPRVPNGKYIHILDKILYDRYFNFFYFNLFVELFKKNSDKNKNGVYNDYPVTLPNQKYLLIPFCPLIYEKNSLRPISIGY